MSTVLQTVIAKVEAIAYLQKKLGGGRVADKLCQRIWHMAKEPHECDQGPDVIVEDEEEEEEEMEMEEELEYLET